MKYKVTVIVDSISLDQYDLVGFFTEHLKYFKNKPIIKVERIVEESENNNKEDNNSE